MIIYKNIYFKRTIIFLLVVIISFNSIFIQTSEASILTLAAAWGGTVIAKEVLALVVALAGMGITIATQEQAYLLYDDLKTNNPTLLQQMISVLPQVWTGAYNEVIPDLQDIKTGVVTWLTGIFGTLQQGQNIYTTDTIVDYTGVYDVYPLAFIVNGNGKYTDSIIWRGQIITYELNVINFEYETYSINYKITSTSGKEVKGSATGRYKTEVGRTYNWKIHETLISMGNSQANYGILYSNDVPIGSHTGTQGNTIATTISADAPALNPEWDPENDRKYPVPPLLLPKYPEIPIKEVRTPTGGKQLEYEGSIEEYLEDITNDMTWEYLDQYIKGQAPTTTLTPTGTGSLVVGGTITDGLPYPYPNTDAPTGVLEGIGSLGGLLEGITNWLSELLKAILSIPELLTDIFAIPNDLSIDFSPLKLENFKNKFPFSIPWDLYNSILVFSAEPVEPELKIDIDTEYLKVYHVIDLSMIQTPLFFARYVMVIFFIIFLILKTRDLIKW